MKNFPLFATFKTALFSILLFSASCKHDTEVVSPGGDGTTSLACAGKSLRLSAVTLDPPQDLDGDGKIDTDVLKFVSECSRDNTIRFEGDGRLTGDEGKLQCANTGDDAAMGVKPTTWTYNAQTRVLRITVNGDAANITEWQDVTVTANSIKGSVVTNSESGKTMKMIMTYQAI